MALAVSRRYGWYVLALLTAANFLHYGNRNIVFSMYDGLRGQFELSNAELGLLGTVFMLSHALATPVFGWAGDHLDRRRVIAFGLILWSLAGAVSAVAPDYATLLVSRALAGAGTAACVPLCNTLLCELYDQGEKARTVAIFNLGLFLGGAIGFSAGALLDYRAGFLLLALPGLALVPLVAKLGVPAHRVRVTPGSSMREFATQVAQLLHVPTMRWVLAGAAIMAFAAGGYQAWLFDFLTQVKGLDNDAALLILGLSLVGGLLGVLAGGYIADRMHKIAAYGRLATISVGMGCTVPCAVASIYLEVGAMFYVTSWLTMFFIMWYHGPMAAVVDDLAKDDRAATAQAGVIFVMHLAGTAPSSWLVGKLADFYDLQSALLVPTLAVLVAALVLIGGWRTMAADRADAHSGEFTGGAL